MPKGPKGEKRPRDPNQWAKRITDIVSGEVEDREPGVSTYRVALTDRRSAWRFLGLPLTRNSGRPSQRF
jgi:hypothetical protein